MSLQELIEWAILDAMGLLDQDEQAQFDAAFKGATPAVQAQVRREQTRLAMIDSLLPDVTPPAGLRAAVLDAVRRQIVAAQAAELDGVAGQITPPMIRSTAVSPYWRMASLGLAAAAVVLGFTMFQMDSEYRKFQESIRQDVGLQKMVETLGASYVKGVLFGPDTQRVLFSDATGAKVHTSVFYNPEWPSAKIFHEGLGNGDGRKYQLAIIDEHDKVVQVLHTFVPAGAGLDSSTFALKQAPAVGSKLAIITESSSGDDQILERGEWAS
jgi:hypothetical protein